MAKIRTRCYLKEAKKLLESAKGIFLKHFGEDYHLIQNVQSLLDWVDPKLIEIGEG